MKPIVPLADIELDEEPAEVEVKPILTDAAPNNNNARGLLLQSSLDGHFAVNIVVEGPSSDEHDSSDTLVSSQEHAMANTTPPPLPPPPPPLEEPSDDNCVEGLGERFVEGAEESSAIERKNSSNNLRGAGSFSIGNSNN